MLLKKLLPVWLLVLSACTGNEKQPGNSGNPKQDIADAAYRWTKITDSAQWKKSYNFQLLTIHDTLRVLHHDGTWFSADGHNWERSALPNAINNQGFLDYVFFNDALYGLGHFEGNIEHFRFSPTIYRSADMKHWDTISTNSNLPARYFYHPFVFNNKIWIIGGEDKDKQYSDIWTSADAKTWKKEKDSLPFGPRSNSQVVILHDTLYLLNNDVWRSADGLNWQQVSNEIVKGESIFGYGAVVFDNKIWLLGCNRNGQFTSQVLCSTDGKSWTGHSAPWLPRGGVAATVFHNSVYITGGKYGGLPDHPDFRYDNDLWKMEAANQQAIQTPAP